MRSRAIDCLVLALAGAVTAGLDRTPARADGATADWNGFYAGAQLGGAWSTLDWEYKNANFFNTNGPTVVGNTFDLDPRGVLGGAVGGYNFQTGAWVLGLELAASAANMNEERASPFFPTTDVATSQIKWLTSASVRLGYAFDRWLVFAKGGWAGAEARVTLYDQGAAVYAAEDQWANGWTVGGGAEYMLCDLVSLGVAYDYADLNIDNKSITCPACNGGGRASARRSSTATSRCSRSWRV